MQKEILLLLDGLIYILTMTDKFAGMNISPPLAGMELPQW